MALDRGAYRCERCGYEVIPPSRKKDPLREYEKAGIPKRFFFAEWDGMPDMLPECKGLYLQGGCGTGKTHAAMAVARKCVDSGWKVRVTSGVKLLSRLRDAMSDNSSEDVFKSLSGADLLVIDDLGKENPTEWVVSMLYRVVDERYGSMRTTVVTTNYSKRELIDRLTVNGDTVTAESIVSRLFEMTEKVDFGSDDRRLS